MAGADLNMRLIGRRLLCFDMHECDVAPNLLMVDCKAALHSLDRRVRVSL